MPTVDEAIEAHLTALRESGASVESFVDPWGVEVFTSTWRTDAAQPRGVIQLVHGIGDHMGRYRDTAQRLTAAGYHVIADDHRGHGATGARALDDLSLIGRLGPGGLQAAIRDVYTVTGLATKLGDGQRPILFGHSWGSFIAQHLLNLRSRAYDAAILTGTGYCQPGWVHSSRFNRAWQTPEATGFEWLSSVSEVAERFAADPLTSDCTVLASHGFWDALHLMTRPSPSIRSDLPLFIANGVADPVASPKSVERLARAYREVGLQNVSVTIYPGMRHEIFNERDADRFFADLLAWLDDNR
ncbi:alpha/beta hydrolase [Pseudoclavibacter soli]|uniref:alpha/beta hydrolase n=1 Tax=Pseudoclavibacter soli TaxID=452623 RepID=UPI00041F2D8B|nr:alpha/beta fold hydrolase [Pseudoclavibacter soli]